MTDSETAGNTVATTVGNYFVSNYPPFAYWNRESLPQVEELLESTAESPPPLGLYLHLPFCRVRCDFCYFKVVTDADSKTIRRYIETLLVELRLYANMPYFADRPLELIYFGGGTPSYLSVEQLEYLITEMQKLFPWDQATEVTFECEPGTLQDKKIRSLKKFGVTRLSLGVENYDAEILELNNRAHRDKEIYRAYDSVNAETFPQTNIDLIAGMVGETEANWQRCIEETIRLNPDSVTVYQMELPFNTTISRRMKDDDSEAPVADWETKRRWTKQAFTAFKQAGYLQSSAYTVKRSADISFQYRDALWRGADLLGIGMSSFSYLGGIHIQNEHQLAEYMELVEAGKRPLRRAMVLSDEERLIREFVLQMKLGRVGSAYFQNKFGVDVLSKFRTQLERHQQAGFLILHPDAVELTESGLLRVDELLHDYFLPQHRGTRYV